MERKIIQIAAVPDTRNMRASTYALCDDGSLFVAYDITSDDESDVWLALPGVPQGDVTSTSEED